MATATECRYEVLAQQSDALQAIFESLPWGVVVADQEGRLLFSNPAAEEILGIGIVEALPGCTSVEGWYLPDQVSVLYPINCPWFAPFAGKRLSMSSFSCATLSSVPECGSE